MFTHCVVWNSVCHKLEACIQRTKERREDAERRDRYARRNAEMTTHIEGLLKARRDRDEQLFMLSFDALELPTVTALLADDSDWQSVEGKWDTVKEQIEKDMDDFAETTRLQLINDIISRKRAALSDHLSVDAATQSNVLLLPSTFFQCENCGDQLQYPSLLRHGCLRKAEQYTFNVAVSSLAETVLAYIRTQGDSCDMYSIIESEFLCLRCDENISVPMDWCDLVRYTRCYCAAG